MLPSNPSAPRATGFMVLHSNQLEGLRDLMLAYMGKHPLPPLSPEMILVQSNGMKHWLEMALAKHVGICAGTHIDLPSTQLWQMYRAVLGADNVPAHMALDKSPLVWRIMRRLPVLLTQEAFAPLQRYLSQGSDSSENGQQRRLYQLALQLADVLDGYQNYRADWLEDWAAGRLILRPSAQATQGPALPAAHQWQAFLWRDVLDDLRQETEPNASSPHLSRAQVHAAFLNKLHNMAPGTHIAGVPERLMVFGVTSLPMQTVEALAALGRVCQVLMLVQNPCQYHWGHVVESRQPLRALQKQRHRHKPGLPLPDAANILDDPTRYALHTQSHPLLAAWGKQGRDYLHLLDTFDDVAQYQAFFSRVDVFIDPLATTADRAPKMTQLTKLQSDILNLEPAPVAPALRDPSDHSIEWVQTHSAQREVEVLHDKLLGWLDAHPHLQPSDIMVMVPDIAVFAPHIHAVFNRYDSTDSRYIPYAVADTSPATEPMVQALESLLQLPQLQITQLEWHNWFEVDAIRHRFGLSAQEVDQLHTWLQEAGVRWGLDATHRTRWGMAANTPDGEQNTWLFGLQRLLLGYAHGHTTDDTGAWQNTLPLSGVGGLDAHLIDGLLQWLRHVTWALKVLRQAHSPTQWVEVLQQLLARFFKANNEREERLLERLLTPLENWLRECTLAGFDAPVSLAVVREHWMAQLQQPAMHQRFFGGGVQFASLMPMRAIPFSVVCLLGMNDADYPRQHTPRDFDLMRQTALGDAHAWRAGDRSRREDDRYLFLEALLSAREKLYISWQGRRVTDHEKMPPSVLVSQLMDHLNACWTPHCEAPLQPLQAFSPLYFQANSPFETYATDWQSVQTKKLNDHSDDNVHANTYTNTSKNNLNTTPAIGSKPEATQPTLVTAQDLRRLLKQPVDVFFRDCLQTFLDTPSQTVDTEEPFALNGLDRYLLVSHMVHAHLQGAAVEQLLTPLRLRGQLALAGFGQLQQQQLLTQCNTLIERLTPALADWPEPLPVQSALLEWPGLQLQAQWADDDTLWRYNAETSTCLQIDVRAGSVIEGKGKQATARTQSLTSVWLNHLLACASGQRTCSWQVGLNGVVQLDPLDASTALSHLHDLLLVYQLACTRPLPVARKSACALLQAQDSTPQQALEAARQVFDGHARKKGEYSQSEHLKRAFAGFDDLAAELPSWAARLYGPMVAAAHWVAHEETA